MCVDRVEAYQLTQASLALCPFLSTMYLPSALSGSRSAVITLLRLNWGTMVTGEVAKDELNDKKHNAAPKKALRSLELPMV